MSDESQNRAVQIYTPSGLTSSSHVSVSGLDLSRDRQELLVSYESDQIYTFPIFPNTKLQGCSVASQVEEVQASISPSEDDEEGRRTVTPLRELATYGAHLNRFTFLKNARYAGPRDEYICTGSDSGHAWIYEKATGAVASFWMADNSTCNGVIPHPSLPVFVTYGIDSTAKLWRSTIPVDRDVDDSAVGRRRHFSECPYEMSPTTRNWEEVNSVLNNLDLRDGGIEETDVYPDQIPSTRILMRRGRLTPGVPRIGNDLQNLRQTLKENLYTCLRSLYEDDDVPVESGIEELKQRVSAIRLRYQADCLGLKWSLSVPWALESQRTVTSNEARLKDRAEDHDVDPADLVPDFPSDWIPYDPDLSSDPFDFCHFFNLDEYLPFYANRYPCLSENSGISLKNLGHNVPESQTDEETTSSNGKKGCKGKVETSGNVQRETDSEEEVSEDGSKPKCAESLQLEKILLETMTTLKEGGNRALKAGRYDVAASRYDKAIQYGSVFYMKNFAGTLGGMRPILRTLVVSRLNMSHLLLKPHFSELQVAERQAKLALKDLEGLTEIITHIDDISAQNDATDDILRLQAKAFFRMGSAQLEMGDYSNAIKAFEESIECTGKLSGTDSKPDQLVVRRLTEAKREQAKRKKRQRKKFKLAFTSSSEVAASPPSPASSIASASMDVSETPQNPRQKPAVVSDTKPRATAHAKGN
jgi:tetratricopeptide (TPR) repeat protein